MRAAIIPSYEAAPTVTDAPEPTGAGELVTVVAAGINPCDLDIATGEFPPIRPETPYIAGLEGVGQTADGRKFYFSGPSDVRQGSLAERTFVDLGQAFELPAGTDPANAIGAGIAGLAGWMATRYIGGAGPGQRVIVTGATGASGRVAVQAAKLAGAERVVAVGRSQAGLDRALELGADVAVRLDGSGAGDLAEELRKAAGGGVDLVVDHTWGAPATAALSVCGPGAKLIQVGASAGEHVSLSGGLLRAAQLTIFGFALFELPYEERQRSFQEMLEHAADGRLQLDTESIALEELSAGWERQAASPGTKLVIQVG